MKKILWVLLSTAAMTACNKSQDSVTPSNDQKVLGLVLQAPASNSGGLILLKDGRTINPVTGFSSTAARAGSKFVFSFEELPSDGSNVRSVRVTNFTEATDSTFTPPPSCGGVDTTKVGKQLQGTYTGTFTYSTVSTANAADTTKNIKNIKVVFTGRQYNATFTSDNSSGGSGTFSLFNSPYVGLKFDDSKTYPAGYETKLLKGAYYIINFDANSITLMKYDSYTHSIYILKK